MLIWDHFGAFTEESKKFLRAAFDLEIISKEFASRAHVAMKFIFVCLGLGLMAAIALFV